MKIYTPSGLEVDINKLTNGDIEVNVICPPKTFDTIEESQRDMEETVSATLNLLKKEGIIGNSQPGNKPVQKKPPPDSALKNTIWAAAEAAEEFYMANAWALKLNPIALMDLYAEVKGIEAVTAGNANTDPDTMKWDNLFKYWLFELGPSSTINFGPNAYMTKDLKNQTGVNRARQAAFDQIAVGNLKIVQKDWQYGFEEMKNQFKTGTDAQLMLGSYETSVDITNDGNGIYTLNFTVNNTTGWESATRFRKSLTEDGQGQGIIPDRQRGDYGIPLGGNLNETFTWSEVVYNPSMLNGK